MTSTRRKFNTKLSDFKIKYFSYKNRDFFYSTYFWDSKISNKATNENPIFVIIKVLVIPRWFFWLRNDRQKAPIKKFLRIPENLFQLEHRTEQILIEFSCWFFLWQNENWWVACCRLILTYKSVAVKWVWQIKCRGKISNLVVLKSPGNWCNSSRTCQWP